MEVSLASVVLLPCVPSSVGTARGQLRSELRACGIFPGTIGDAALVVSELLSNAILHARPLPGSQVRVSWALGPAWIELAVGDGGSETLPRAFHPSLSSIGGRGLAIGRLYDPSGKGELAPLDDFGRQNLGALNIEFRSEGDWQAA